MTNPITPPPELVRQWFAAWESSDNEEMSFAEFAIPSAAQWGADQELEACCKWLDRNNQWARVDLDELRDGRRPKPLSLKEQSLALIDLIQGNEKAWDTRDLDVVRRALEQLNG